jgi:hypothetical protein
MIIVAGKPVTSISVVAKTNSSNPSLSVVKNNIVTNVVVANKKEFQVSTNANSGLIDSTTPVTLKTIPTVSVGGVERLDHLKDVDVLGESNGAILTYDGDTQKWIAQQINFGKASLDGGNF